MNGVLGPVTSSVDFCEANWAYTPYVCELFNTLSSFAMVVAGALGLMRFRAEGRARYRLAFALLVFVGLGSVAFHATMKWQLQLFDEIPMLYLVLCMVFILLEPGTRAPWRQVLFVGLLGYAAVTTYLCAFTRGRVQFWCFQFGFGSLELFCLARASWLFTRTRDAGARKLFAAGMTMYVVAILAWFIDIRWCPRLFGVDPKLHALWHVLVSAGFYQLIAFLMRTQAGPVRGAAARVAPASP